MAVLVLSVHHHSQLMGVLALFVPLDVLHATVVLALVVISASTKMLVHVCHVPSGARHAPRLLTALNVHMDTTMTIPVACSALLAVSTATQATARLAIRLKATYFSAELVQSAALLSLAVNNASTLQLVPDA
jgi:hypothetical protein